jgi:hypothetical protein
MSVGGATSGPCDPGGTWAVQFQTNVKWPDNEYMGTTLVILNAGSGSQTLRMLSKRTYDASTKKVTDSATICSVTLPKFMAVTGAIQLVFPDSVFDTKPIPAMLTYTLSASPGVGTTFQSDAGQILVGAMGLSVTDQWPVPTAIMSVDADGDGNPGITAQENGSGVPVVAVGSTADRVYVAFRSVAKLSGTTNSCDRMSGAIDLQSVDQSILGCRIKGGTSDCAADEVKFVNDNSPRWMPDAASTITMQRVSEGAACKDVRALTF